MQRLLFFVLLLVFSVLCKAQEERVYTFQSEVTIDTSGVIVVQETIRIYAEGNLFKRGITRALPLSRSEKDGNRIRINYTVLDVQKNGVSENFFTKKENGNLVIYAGEKDVFLSPDFYTYRIRYETAGQIGFFDDYDELAWNINGESDKNIDTVSTIVHLPENAKIISTHCYTGVYGSTQSNCTTNTLADGLLRVQAVDVQPRKLLTVAVGFTKGIVHQPVVKVEKPRELTFFDKNGLPFVTATVLLSLLIYYFFTWRKYGIDPPKPTVVPLFSPPEGLSPASVGMLHREKFVDDFVTSSIVSLAVKSYLRIKEKVRRKGLFGIRQDRIYTLIKLKETDELLPKEEQLVLNDLFVDSDEITLDGTHDSQVENAMSSFRYNLKNQYNPILKEGRNWKFLILPWLLMLAYVATLIYFVNFEPIKQTASFMVSVALSLFVLNIIAILLRKVFQKSKIKWFSYTLGTALIVGSLSLLLFFSIKELSVNAMAFIVGFPLIVVGYLTYAYLIKRPGERKLYLQSQIEGLKMYMHAAEEKQLQHFNPPTITPEIFEKLLPYAIALDMEEIWGQQFEKSLLASSAPESPPYHAPWFAGAVLSPSDFGHTLNSTLSNTVNHAATPPNTSSSGGSWSSGSFGGGFSGMGGGGGGVGGW